MARGRVGLLLTTFPATTIYPVPTRWPGRNDHLRKLTLEDHGQFDFGTTGLPAQPAIQPGRVAIPNGNCPSFDSLLYRTFAPDYPGSQVD